MKKALVIVLLVTLLAMFATGASAITVGSATIGGEKQERTSNVTTTFTVTNNGTTNLIGVTVSTNADGKYGIIFTPQTFNLTAGETKTITVQGNIPLDFPAVESDSSKSDYLEPKAFKIGDIVVNDGSSSTSADLKMQAMNHLRIKSATFYCGDKSTRLSDNAKVSNLKPDTNGCYVSMTVENTFRENSEIEFDTVDVEIQVDDEDFDVFETSSIDGLPADENDEVDSDDLTFDIDEEVKDRTYTMALRIFGNDDNNAFHGVIWNIKLDVVRETYDIQIKDAKMSPVKFDCKGGTLKLDATIINLGKKNDDEVAVEVDIPDLGINSKKTNIDLDTDDSTGVSFAIKIPESVAEGIHPVNMNTYFKGTALSNTKTFELVVEKCAAESVKEETPIVTPTTPTTSTIPAGATPAAPRARISTEDSGFKESTAYLWLLGIVAVVLAVIIITIVIVFFVKKK
ncbi:MAG: hypothetical protein QW666_00070 [Candidatus Woesearchaeota archaeon]